MTRRNWAWLAALAFGIAFGLTATTRAADEKGATGKWTWSYTRPNSNDPVVITLKLKQDGEKLTGTIASPREESEIKDGSVRDGKVSFKVERERDGRKLVQRYTGMLDGDAIKGKAVLEFEGNKRERDWEAKRAD